MTPRQHQLLVEWARQQRRNGRLRAPDCHQAAAERASWRLGFAVDPQLLAAAVATLDAEAIARRRQAERPRGRRTTRAEIAAAKRRPR